MFRLVACLSAALFCLPQVTRADERICRGELSGVFDDIRVPRGATCTLSSAHVRGNINVRSNALLKVYPQTIVVGNIQAEGARGVRLHGLGVFINGDVQVKYGTRLTLIRRGTRVGGNVQYEENSGSLIIRGSRINGDVQVFENSGGAAIFSNVIDGNLQCKENDPEPEGENNRVGGNKEDQCATF